MTLLDRIKFFFMSYDTYKLTFDLSKLQYSESSIQEIKDCFKSYSFVESGNGLPESYNINLDYILTAYCANSKQKDIINTIIKYKIEKEENYIKEIKNTPTVNKDITPASNSSRRYINPYRQPLGGTRYYESSNPTANDSCSSYSNDND